MLVGEQPGDREDHAGEPFVGLAGGILDAALEDAGIDRGDAYVTNVVKHFKWRQGRGKHRLHQRPNAEEVAPAGRGSTVSWPWFVPGVVVCLGATAAKALLGGEIRVSRDRGQFLETEFAAAVTVTVHPSAILRIPEPDERAEARAELTADLRRVAKRLRDAE
jgi:DNA polymerase